MAIIKKVVFQCGWCWREFDEGVGLDEIEKHHDECLCNPKNKACSTCIYNFEPFCPNDEKDVLFSVAENCPFWKGKHV
jgi:hypothetical protein